MNTLTERPSERVLDAARTIAGHLSIQEGNKLTTKAMFKLLIPHLVKLESDTVDELRLENLIILEECINGYGRN